MPQNIENPLADPFQRNTLFLGSLNDRGHVINGIVDGYKVLLRGTIKFHPMAREKDKRLGIFRQLPRPRYDFALQIGLVLICYYVHLEPKFQKLIANFDFLGLPAAACSVSAVSLFCRADAPPPLLRSPFD